MIFSLTADTYLYFSMSDTVGVQLWQKSIFLSLFCIIISLMAERYFFYSRGDAVGDIHIWPEAPRGHRGSEDSGAVGERGATLSAGDMHH